MSRTWHAGTCSALSAVAQASDTATAAAGAAAAAASQPASAPPPALLLLLHQLLLQLPHMYTSPRSDHLGLPRDSLIVTFSRSKAVSSIARTSSSSMSAHASATSAAAAFHCPLNLQTLCSPSNICNSSMRLNVVLPSEFWAPATRLDSYVSTAKPTSPTSKTTLHHCNNGSVFCKSLIASLFVEPECAVGAGISKGQGSCTTGRQLCLCVSLHPLTVSSSVLPGFMGINLKLNNGSVMFS